MTTTSFNPLRAFSQDFLPVLRMGGPINTPHPGKRGSGIEGWHRLSGVLSSYGSSFLGKQRQKPLTPEATQAHRKLLPLPAGKQSWHTPSVFPGAWLEEPSASVAGAGWLGRPWIPSGPASACPGLLFGLEELPDCLAVPFFLSWFFIVVRNARLGAGPIDTSTLAIFQTSKFFTAWSRNPNTGCTELLRTHWPAFTGGSQQRFCLWRVREERRAQAGFRAPLQKRGRQGLPLPQAASRHYTAPSPQAERGIGSGMETDVARRSILIPPPAPRPHVGPPTCARCHLRPARPPAARTARPRMRIGPSSASAPPTPARALPRNRRDFPHWPRAFRPTVLLVTSSAHPSGHAPLHRPPYSFARSGLAPETLGNRCRPSRLLLLQPINSRRFRGACWER